MAIRVLTQINNSSSANPEGDSGLYFISHLIKWILAKSAEFHFYVLIPTTKSEIWISALKNQRITPILIDTPTRSHGGAFYFDPVMLIKKLNLRNFEFDFIFINQPELVNPYLHLFNKLLFHNIPVITYTHWFDTRVIKSKNGVGDPILMSAISGMLCSKYVGCNSEYGKERILEYSSKIFSTKLNADLQSKMSVIPPGFDSREFDKFRPKTKKVNKIRRKRIIINHRILKYTGVRNLLTNTFPKLWKLRQDFKVVVTNPTRVRLPKEITSQEWLRIGNFNRKEYIKELWKADIVVCPHKATHWSISTLEALYTFNVPLMTNNSFFLELMKPLIQSLNSENREHIESKWFYNNGSLTTKLNSLLNSIEDEKTLIKLISPEVKNTYDWEIITEQWLDLFVSIDNDNNQIQKTNPSFCRILEMINKSGGQLSKHSILKNLVWGPQSSRIAWTSFRSSLKKVATDEARNKEVIYKLPKNL